MADTAKNQQDAEGKVEPAALVGRREAAPFTDSDNEQAAPVEVTPLPRKQMAALTVVLMTESICGSMLLPFVPRFIAYLMNIAVEDAGYYSGILVGLFMLGQVVSSKLWGHMSDTYGRKVSLTTGLLASGIAMLLFGSTKSFVVCCVLRFLHGFFNGNTLVAKTMIADITDHSNAAQGFALVSITWGVGSLFGPFIGGFLYNPTAKSYLHWVAGGAWKSFLAAYPAFLPSFVIFLYTGIALLACVVFLRETNPHRRQFRDTRLGLFLMGLLGRRVKKASQATDVVVVVALSHEEEPITALPKQDDAATAEESPPPHLVHHRLTYAQALRIDALRNITFFYMILSSSDMAYGEILPLWGNADRAVGGMGLMENSVAVLMLSYSIPSVLGNIYFPHVCRYFDEQYIVFWRWSLGMYTVSILLIPLGSKLGSAGYYYVMVLGMVRQVGVSWCYSLIHMLTAKAAPLGCVGSVYGISQSLAAATRCVVPFVVAPLFAWSLSKGHVFPFNYFLVFFVAAAISAVSVVMSFYVTITRTEVCELDPDLDVALHNHHHSAASSVNGRGDDSAEEAALEERESVYASLAGSLCQPLQDTYVNLTDLERVNVDGMRERQHHLTMEEDEGQGVEDGVNRRRRDLGEREDARHHVELGGETALPAPTSVKREGSQ